MNARIIPLPRDEHHEVQLLLPWYVTGKLEPAETARVEAHLGGCETCQADLALEHRLAGEIRDLSVGLEDRWARLQARIAAEPAAEGPAPRPMLASRARPRRPAWVGWAIAAQFIFAVALGALLAPRLQPAQYHTLGAPPAAAAQLMVVFRPETREQELRAVLAGAGARLVDGPTATGAYRLSVPPDRLAASLAKLRTSTSIVLAEPLDAAEPR